MPRRLSGLETSRGSAIMASRRRMRGCTRREARFRSGSNRRAAACPECPRAWWFRAVLSWSPSRSIVASSENRGSGSEPGMPSLSSVILPRHFCARRPAATGRADSGLAPIGRGGPERHGVRPPGSRRHGGRSDQRAGRGAVGTVRPERRGPGAAARLGGAPGAGLDQPAGDPAAAPGPPIGPDQRPPLGGGDVCDGRPGRGAAVRAGSAGGLGGGQAQGDDPRHGHRAPRRAIERAAARPARAGRRGRAGGRRHDPGRRARSWPARICSSTRPA